METVLGSACHGWPHPQLPCQPQTAVERAIRITTAGITITIIIGIRIRATIIVSRCHNNDDAASARAIIKPPAVVVICTACRCMLAAAHSHRRWVQESPSAA